MRFAQSPLFEPVLWKGDGFKILDETLIPERIEYILVTRISQALEAVRDMRTRAFGQVLTFLYSAALVAEHFDGPEPEPLRKRIEEMTRQFCDARPTFDFKGLGDYILKRFADLPSSVSCGEWVAEQVRGLAGQIVKARQGRAKRTASILPSPARVLTHCNVSGELVAVARYCKEMGKHFSVIATETRPYLQGTRLTAWELTQAGVSVDLIPDNAVAQVMANGEINAIVVGSDRCAQNGDIINKVGTYPLALIAKEYGVPFYALVQDPGSLVQGDDVAIEERPVLELLNFQGRSLVPEAEDQVAGRYPAFDITPSFLICNLIGFDDLFTPESFRKRYLRNPSSPAKNTRKQSEKYLLVYGLPKNDSYAFLVHALKAEQADRILVPEMRPERWGAHVVVRELMLRHAPATFISDNMMGTLFAHRQIRKLYFFYSGLSEQGPSGICGSLLAVHLARAHGVGIELLESEASREASTDHDVSTFLGQDVMPEGVNVYPLEQEVIPWALLRDPQGTDS
jgi:methylthioribose-1-phosphate isomerase